MVLQIKYLNISLCNHGPHNLQICLSTFCQKETAGGLNIKDGFDQEEDAKSLNGDCQCSGGQLLTVLCFCFGMLKGQRLSKLDVYCVTMDM